MQQGEKKQSENILDDATYYEIFIHPALEMIAEEKADVIGRALVKYICLDEKPDFNSEDDKLCWNIVMLAVEAMFNASIKDDGE